MKNQEYVDDLQQKMAERSSKIRGLQDSLLKDLQELYFVSRDLSMVKNAVGYWAETVLRTEQASLGTREIRELAEMMRVNEVSF